MPYRDPHSIKAKNSAHRRGKKWRQGNKGKDYYKRKSKTQTRKRMRDIHILKDKFGGKCEVCGYNKNYSALAFHHKNEDTKNFHIGEYRRRSLNLEDVISEAAKCQLLCFNCHQEIHNPHQRRA